MRDGRYLLGMSTKMYFTHAQTLQWCRDVSDLCRTHPAVTSGAVELFVLPGFLSLAEAAKIMPGVGAQDVSWADGGAYTGEVSAAQLVEIGATYVEVGHAERRRLFGEDDAVVAAKTAVSLRHGLTPVLCVGETAHVPVDEAVAFCQAQITAALHDPRHPHPGGRVVVAYEPVWAIGASEPADAAHISGVCRPLREWLAADPEVKATVIYGGSAGPGLLRRIGDDVDGLFLGRLAHQPQGIANILDDIAFLRSAQSRPLPSETQRR